jgi:hypothetical protein
MGTRVKAKKKWRPLEITCTSSDCEQGLHCFRATQRMKDNDEEGCCRQCGADLIDWARVHKQRLSDHRYTFEALKHEMVRHYFWHKEIDRRAINHARRKGRKRMRAAVLKRIRSSVGVKHSRDGRQTPYEHNSIFYAQHAAACCCRKCIEYWYGVPQSHTLTDEQILFFSELCLMYIFERLPDLAEDGMRVPNIHKKEKSK